MHNIRIASYLLLIQLLFVINSHAQQDAQSPYSFYGIGSPQKNSLQNGFAMGSVFSALRDSNTINFLNPAAYTAIDVTQFIFGVENNIVTRNYSNTSQQDFNVYINQLGLGIPAVKKKMFGWGVYLGFSPYSQVGYSFKDSTRQYFGNDTVMVNELYNGNGGINQVTLGNGFRISKFVSIGINTHFIFGTINRNRSLIMPISQDYLSSRVQKKTKLEEFAMDAGIQFHHFFKVKTKVRPASTSDSIISRKNWETKISKIYFNIGATYTLGRKMNVAFDQLGIQYISGNTELGVDTFELVPPTIGSITLPHGFSGGLQFTNAKSWSVVADFNYSMWSGFSYFDQPSTQYFDTWGIGVGAEIDPAYKNKNLGKNQFFKNILYRLGSRYQNRYFRPDLQPIDEVGISFGLGLPVAFGNKIYNENETRIILSYINIGIEGGFANSRNNGIVNESFFRLNVGVTIRDKWFIKRRFN